MSEAQRGFLAVMRALLPRRDGRRPPLADWLACRDIAEAWDLVRSGAVTPEATPP